MEVKREEFPAATTKVRKDTSTQKTVVSGTVAPVSDKSSEPETVAKMNELPAEATSDFYEAMRVAPHIVFTESPPATFATTKLLARYWRERRRVFGTEHAFSPLVQTGEGALSHDDIALLRTGYFMILPSSTEGDEFRTIFVDSSENDPWASDRESSLRCLFYLLSVLSLDDTATDRAGFRILIEVESPDYSARVGDSCLESLVHLATEAFPAELVDLHIASIRPADEIEPFNAQMRALIDETYSDIRCILHLALDADEMREKLKKFGFSKATLPSSLGGLYDLAAADDWHEERANSERETVRHGTGSFNRMGGMTLGGQGEGRPSNITSSSSDKPASSSSLDEHRKAQQDLSNIPDSSNNPDSSNHPDSSSISSDRVAAEGSDDAGEVKQPALKAPLTSSESSGIAGAERSIDERAELPPREQAAKKLGEGGEDAVDCDDADQSQEELAEQQKQRRRELYKQKTAIYSRRKYIRKKIEVEVLEDQSYKVEAQNADLKQENSRLENLYAEAQRIVSLYETFPTSNIQDPNQPSAVFAAQASAQDMGGAGGCTGDSSLQQQQQQQQLPPALIQLLLRHAQAQAPPPQQSQPHPYAQMEVNQPSPCFQQAPSFGQWQDSGFQQHHLRMPPTQQQNVTTAPFTGMQAAAPSNAPAMDTAQQIAALWAILTSLLQQQQQQQHQQRHNGHVEFNQPAPPPALPPAAPPAENTLQSHQLNMLQQQLEQIRQQYERERQKQGHGSGGGGGGSGGWGGS